MIPRGFSFNFRVASLGDKWERIGDMVEGEILHRERSNVSSLVFEVLREKLALLPCEEYFQTKLVP